VARPLARQFALLKGAWPIGSVVRLSNGRLALVIGWSPGQAHGRPVVQSVEAGGALGVPIDLAENPGIQILEAAAPSAVKLDLSRLHPSVTHQTRRTPASPRRSPGPSVSLSYEVKADVEGPDEPTGFDLSIDDANLTEDSLCTVNRVTLEHPTSRQPRGSLQDNSVEP
jgi:hypothetical protein